MTSVLVPLGSSGLFACVDEADAVVLSGSWWIDERATTTYARSALKRPWRKFYLHRVIAGRMGLSAKTPIDHIDGNGLNCSRSNLRAATIAENMRNRGRQSNNRSGFKGVHWCPYGRNWRARIAVDGKITELGRHRDPATAARAYDAAARDLFGEFARLNFPDGAHR